MYFTAVEKPCHLLAKWPNRAKLLTQLCLLEAEREKFNSGESSVFLINTREQQLFDLRVQETEIATQLKLQEIEIQYLFGDL